MKTYSGLYGNQIHHSEINTDRAYFGGPTGSVEVDETRPEHSAKALLESRYRLEIWPSFALQDSLDARVVDTSERFSIAEAHAVHRTLQVEDKLTRDLSAVVGRGHVGPFLRALAGRGASRPGHRSSVDDTEGAAE